MTGPVRIVTISSAYGAGGAVVGRQVSARLQLPFLERLVTPTVARRSANASPDAEGEERPERVWRRVVEELAGLPLALAGAPMPVEGLSTEEQVRNEVESSIEAMARTTGGVVQGRGGMVVLHDRPGVFHVRLSGPPSRRVAQAVRLADLDEREASRRQAETDRARAAYLKRFYDCRPDDPALYHLVLDSTVIPLDTCTNLIVAGATAIWEAS